MFFKAGSSADTHLSSSVPDMPSRVTEEQRGAMIADYMGNMETLAATASANVSKAKLKCIDPNLRPPKTGNRMHPSPLEAHKEELKATDGEPNESRHENAEIDNEEMLIEEGGEPSISV